MFGQVKKSHKCCVNVLDKTGVIKGYVNVLDKTKVTKMFGQ